MISTLCARVLLTYGAKLFSTRIVHGIRIERGAGAGPAPTRVKAAKRCYGASGERRHHRRWKQPTECAMPQSNDQSRSLAALGAGAGSFPVDFPEHSQASVWRRLSPWALGLLTLFCCRLGCPAFRHDRAVYAAGLGSPP